MEKRIYLMAFQLLLLTMAHKSFSQTPELIQQARNIAEGGYSIFDQTMVDMPWTEIEKSIERGAIILLPVAVLEEHGPHMCCGPDIYQANLSAKMIKKELDALGIPCLIAPPLYWGIADIASCFPGTFTVSESTMRSLLSDIFKSLNRWGVKNVVVINGHGEPKHFDVLKASLIESNEILEMNIYMLANEENIARFRIADFQKFLIPVKYRPQIPIDCRYDNSHADCIETGTMAGFFPSLVDTVLARSLEPTNFRGRPEFKSPGDVGLAWEKDARRITPLGYFGDPASFDYEKSVLNYLNDAKSEAEAIESFLKKPGGK